MDQSHSGAGWFCSLQGCVTLIAPFATLGKPLTTGSLVKSGVRFVIASRDGIVNNQKAIKSAIENEIAVLNEACLSSSFRW